jgi:hypothetical protein
LDVIRHSKELVTKYAKVAFKAFNEGIEDKEYTITF